MLHCPGRVVPAKAGETRVKPIAVWANQTQKSASLLLLDSPHFWRNDNNALQHAQKERKHCHTDEHSSHFIETRSIFESRHTGQGTHRRFWPL